MASTVQDADIIQRYILGIMSEFPQLQDALRVARVFKVDIHAEIKKALTPEKVERIKILVEAMNEEINGKSENKKWDSTAGLFG